MGRIYRHAPRILAYQTGDGSMLIAIGFRSEEAYLLCKLNEVGAFVWRLIDGERSVDDLARAVCGEFTASYEQAEQDVTAFLLDLETIGAVMGSPRNGGIASSGRHTQAS